MRKTVLITASVLVLAGVPLGAQTAAQLRSRYPKMAPLAEYLMRPSAEIALARSAAPAAISSHATILVLTRHGWQVAVKGTNGFVCNVERGWTGSIDFPQVWNPKIRGADCLNPAAAQTILPLEYKITQMTLAGKSEAQRIAGLQAAFAKKQLPAVAPGAMGYMMSKSAYVSDRAPHYLAHLMFFLDSRKSDSAWGGGLPGAPLISSSYWFPQIGRENPLEKQLPGLRVLYITVPDWSDGTPVS